MSVTPFRDLRHAFGKARDQGSRPTCCAFACSDAHAAVRPGWTELSCEYAHYHGARRQGTGPDRGVYLATMLDVLQQDGQPRELGWPYSVAPITNVSKWLPPADVGELFNAAGTRIVSNDIASMRSAIDAGQPVVMVIKLSDAFYFGADADGVIDSTEAPDATRVHSVVAVGHGTRGSEALTLVRTSWGVYWVLDGHAWLTDRYLEPRLLEWATLTKLVT